MSYKYDVSVILVNYNGKRFIDTLMKSLYELNTDGIRLEIVFVDNNSSDDSVEYLKQNYSAPNLNIVESKENIGFAGGNNLGVKACQGKYVVLLNNDTKVDKDWIVTLYNRIKDDNTIGMINSKLLFFYDFIKLETKTMDKFNINKEVLINNEKYEIDNKFAHNLLLENSLTCFGNSYFYVPILEEGKDITIKLQFSNYNSDTDYMIVDGKEYYPDDKGELTLEFNTDEVAAIKKTIIQNAGSGINEKFDGYDLGMGEEDCDKYNQEYEINNGCGASIIMLKEDFEKVGGFDESFFMYYEDTDLSYRIRKLGKKIIFYPKSLVRHIHTGSSKEWSPFFIFHVVRNKALFVYKNISKTKGLKLLVRQTLSKDANVRKAAWSGIKIILRGK